MRLSARKSDGSGGYRPAGHAFADAAVVHPDFVQIFPCDLVEAFGWIREAFTPSLRRGTDAQHRKCALLDVAPFELSRVLAIAKRGLSQIDEIVPLRQPDPEIVVFTLAECATVTFDSEKCVTTH